MTTKKRLISLLMVVATVAASIGLYYVSVASDNPEESTDQAACTRYGMTQQISMAPQKWFEASQRTADVTRNGSGEPLGAFVNQNFIDDIIAQTAADNNVPMGAVSGDGEFFRRVNLDLTGRQGTPEEAKAFLDDPNPNKRSELITTLLNSDAFNARLAWYYGELLRLTNVFGNNMGNNITVRNAYYNYVRDAVNNNLPWDQFMRNLVTATGRNDGSDQSADPQIQFIVRARRGYGDIRDAMDEMANTVSRVFLGINIECTNCHSGQRHLEEINTYLAGKRRDDLWGMSAFFSSINFTNPRIPNAPSQQMPEIKAWVEDTGLGKYDRNGGGGIRPNRCPGGAANCTSDPNRYVTPKYMFNDQTVSDDYRNSLADIIKADTQFARAGVNNLWKLAFGIGIVEPIYGFDLAKPDQPSNPALLDRLAQEFRNTGYDVKNMLSLILNSSTYQMSAYWPDTNPTWQDGWSKYNVRHLVREIEPEQHVDSIMQASNVTFDFNIPGVGMTHWAGEFPDVAEPQNHTAIGGSNVPNSITNLLTGSKFDRGNRFSGGNPSGRPNPPVGSILKALTLMNDNGFVLMRLKTATNGTRSKDLYARIQANPGDIVVRHEVVAEIFLATMNRRPTESEMKVGLAALEADPRMGIEDLMWTQVNSIPFNLN